MQTRYVLVLFLLCSYCFGPAGTVQAQQTSTEGGRKVLRKMAPTYPDLARKMNLGGTVKVVAVVAADGDVKAVEPKGGSPAANPGRSSKSISRRRGMGPVGGVIRRAARPLRRAYCSG